MYIKWLPNGEMTEYSIAQLKQDNPNVSFPDDIPDDVLDTYSVERYVEAPIPSYNLLTQDVVSSFVDSGEYWEKQWTVVDKDVAVARQNLIEKVASDRWIKETSGVVWTDSVGDSWYIATDLDSQQRINGVVSAINDDIRTGDGVWKCVQIVLNNGEPQYVVSYRPTSNAEMSELAQLVHDHVQKCFQAEANTVFKINNDNFTATFEQEFNLL